jgi:undecaprenyl diphosphate synthase
MDLFEKYLDDVEEYASKHVRVIFLGDKSYFRSSLREKMISLEERTRNFDEMTLMIAMNYGGRDDIVHAAAQAAELAVSGYIKPDEISESMLSGMLYTAGTPDVDLVIRSGGEYRLSNFLIWQCAYAEYYFTDVLWPDFTSAEVDKAIAAFTSRNRRFGGS